MSAFAALGRRKDVQDYCYPAPLDGLLKTHAHFSNFVFTIENSAFTPTSVFIGLLPSQYIVVHGTYEVKVHRGVCIINNAHKVPNNVFHPIIASSAESLPTLASPDESDETTTAPVDEEEIFHGFATVLELKNLSLGLENLGTYCPALSKLFPQPDYGYTFEVVLEESGSASAIHFDQSTLLALNGACRQLDAVVIFGVPNSGKKTFARTVINNVLLSGQSRVAYLDLDPASVDADHPGCISLRVLRRPVFGEFSFLSLTGLAEEHVHRYYGFASFADRPQLFSKLCDELLTYYRINYEGSGIPLVVKYPPWIKGHGRQLLVDFSKILSPKKMVYLSHNNAITLEDYQADAFEETDHPDLEVLSDFSRKDCSVVRAVRRARPFTKNDLLMRNKLLYFHHEPGEVFNFKEPILHQAPMEFPFDLVPAVSVLNMDDEECITKNAVYDLTEATIMAVYTADVSSCLMKNMYIPSADFLLLRSSFAGLCMVHLVDPGRRIFYVYLRDVAGISEKLQKAKSQGHSVVLVRGEGQIPRVEFTNGMSGTDSTLPYVSFNTMQKLGGIWKVRRNIGRKNQG